MRPPKVLRNSLFVFAARACELATGLLTIGLATRYLGRTLFGEYALIGTTAVTLSPLIALGCGRILVRDVAVKAERAGTLVASCLLLNALLALPVLMVAVVCVLMAGLRSPLVLAAVCLAMGAQTLTILQQTAGAIFVASERMIYDPVIAIATRLVLLCMFGAVILLGLSYACLFLAAAVAAMTGLLMAMHILVRRFVRPVWGVRPAELTYLAGESAPVAAYNFLGSAFVFVNVFVLEHFRGIEQVSLFQAPQRVIGPLMLFPMVVLFAFTPSLFRMGSDVRYVQQICSAYETAVRHIVVLLIPAGLVAGWFADSLAHVLFGEAFAESSASLRILFWVIFPFGLNALLNTLLTGLRKQRGLVVTHLLAIGINLAIAPWMVVRWGHEGASAAMVGSVLALFLMNHLYLYFHVGGGSLARMLLRYAVPPATSCWIVHAVLRQRMADWLSAGISLTVYVAVAYVFRSVDARKLVGFLRGGIQAADEQPTDQP